MSAHNGRSGQAAGAAIARNLLKAARTPVPLTNRRLSDCRSKAASLLLVENGPTAFGCPESVSGPSFSRITTAAKRPIPDIPVRRPRSRKRTLVHLSQEAMQGGNRPGRFRAQSGVSIPSFMQSGRDSNGCSWWKLARPLSGCSLHIAQARSSGAVGSLRRPGCIGFGLLNRCVNDALTFRQGYQRQPLCGQSRRSEYA